MSWKKTRDAKARPRSAVPDNTLAAELMEEASATRMTPVDPDDIHVAVKPPMKFFEEQKYDHLAEEQPPLWKAEGEALAGPHEAEAARLELPARADEVRMQAAIDRYDDSSGLHRKATGTLLRYVHREPYEYLRYNVVRLLLLGGDVAGGTGAAIAGGEIWWLALLQMLAVGAAAVAVGGLAEEVRHIRDARRRAAGGVPKDAEDYPDLFVDPDPGEVVVKYVLLGGLVATVLIGAGILALRALTDGSTFGLLFACLAVVVTLGSGANSYIHADEVDDRLHGFRKELDRGERKLEDAKATCTAAGERAAALKRAESIRRECQARGEAAVARVKAAGRQVLASNPSVAGNGVAAQPEVANTAEADGGTTKRFVPPVSKPSRNGARKRTGP